MEQIRGWNLGQNFKNYRFKSTFVNRNCLLIDRNCLLSIIIDKKSYQFLHKCMKSRREPLCWLRLPFLRPAIHFLYFAFCGYFANVLVKHPTKYETLTKHFSHFMQISCFINATKTWTMKSFDISRKCRLWREMRKKGARNAKKVIQNTPLHAFHFLRIIFVYFAKSV